MFKGMKLGTKLLVAFLIVGVLPFAAIGVTALSKASTALKGQAFNQLEAVREIKKAQIEGFFGDRQSDLGVLVETVSTLREEALTKLTAVREVKRSAVERYFQSINDQIITFSEDEMVVNALGSFRQSFSTVRDENASTPEELSRMRRALGSYYTGDFSTEYRV